MGFQVFSRMLARASVLLAAVALSLPGAAQGTTDNVNLEEVVITGTRIVRPDLTSSSPISSVSPEEIRMTGTVNTEDIIRELPQTLPGISAGVNNGNPGVATVNLRGLEEQRTLVLVDGKRFVGYDSEGIVDLNNIPTALIERVDVVTGGASAVYGSDAMAGVVNFILRRDFEGVEISPTYQATGDGDGDVSDVAITAGSNFADGRGNAVVSMGYTNRRAVTQGERDFSLFSLATADGSISGSFTDTNGNLLGSYVVPGAADTSAQTFVGFDANGDPVATGTRRFNFNPFNYLQVPEQRAQATALLRYDVDDSMELYSRMSLANTQVDAVLAPSGTFFSDYTLPFSNPFLTPLTRQMLGDPDGDGIVNAEFDTNGDGIIDDDATTIVSFGRRTLEVGPRTTINDTTAYQIVLGSRGEFASGLQWDVSGQYGRTQLSRIFQNDINNSRVRQSLNATTDANGNAVCVDTSGGCIAGNFFGDGNLAQDAADYISLQLNEEIYTEQSIIAGSVAGDLGQWTTPWADTPVGFAAGLEYREEKSESFPDQNYQTVDFSPGFGSQVPVSNDYDVTELYAEFIAPVVEGKTWANNITLEGGLRLSDYSTVGNVSAFKFGGAWEPNETLRFRALYQRAVRAPNIFEFGAPRSASIGDADADPCSGALADPALAALCIATGAPSTAVNNGNVPDVIAGQLNVFTGGNADLQEETSDTYTVGVVYQPTFADGLNIQLDYYNISIDDAITTLRENDILAGCYSTALNPTRDANNSFCQLVLRNPVTGGLVGNPAFGLEQLSENIAFLETSGVDLQADYAFDVGDYGNVQVSFVGTYVIDNDKKPSAVSPVNQCAGLYGNTCLSPDPRVRFTQRTTWSRGDIDLSYRWRFLDSVDIDSPAGVFAPYRQIDDYHYIDLAASWAANDKLLLTFGVDNVLDKDPPVIGSESGPTDQNSANTFPGTYDTLGRNIFVNAKLTF